MDRRAEFVIFPFKMTGPFWTQVLWVLAQPGPDGLIMNPSMTVV